MKQVQLKDAMQSLRVVVTDSGYELHSASGMAKYDQWGHRREVSGIPEYFPCNLTIDGKEKASPTPGPNSKNDAPGQLRDIIQRIGSSDAFKDLLPIQPNEGVINNHYHITISADANGKQYAAGMGVGVEDGKKSVQFQADSFEVHDGQVFIKDAFLKTGAVTSAALADKAGEETGDTPTRTRTMRTSYDSNRQRVEDIVGDYLTGEASELRKEMVEELMTLIGEPESASTVTAKRVIEIVSAMQAQRAQQDAAIVTLSSAIANIGETIRESMREAAERGAIEGAKRVRQDILKDFQNRGPIRRTLGF